MTAPKPKVFIGSSTEGLRLARAVESHLTDVAQVSIWKDGVFGLGQGNLEALVDVLGNFDFAVLVLTPDDVTESRDAISNAPRDNVLFELGLFMGRLGRARTFLLFDKDQQLKLPSDLAGVSAAGFKGSRSDGNLSAAVSPACTQIISAIESLGPFTVQRQPLTGHPLGSITSRIVENVERAARINHKVFQSEISYQCMHWRETSTNWSQGQFIVRENYQGLLVETYRMAQKSIFSTSIPDYRPTWFSPLGARLLKVQKENTSVRSTRVFIFDQRSDLTAEDEKLFREHHEAGVEVLLFFDKELGRLLYPPDLGRDWTCIDGGVAIGVTRHVGEFYEACWYFDDAEKAEQFSAYQTRLLDLSEKYQPTSS